MKKPHKNTLNKIKLVLAFSSIVFVLIIISSYWMFTLFWIASKIPYIDTQNLPRHTGDLVMAAFSLILGVVLSVIFKRVIINPLYVIYGALDKIANGDYNINIEPKGIGAVRTVAKKINIMAKELDSIEIMRNDFVNNFSHEFKTPIISIEGFAKMLRDDSLSQAEREEYLSIIISESRRLAELSTNILALNKLENQTILSDQTTFNVSEQLRLCVVLLEKKWAEKNITFDFEGDEYEIYANENLLQQLWLNIIDNAIKYSPESSEIKIRISRKGHHLHFIFEDKGKGMTEEQIAHAFDRFYQADINHKTGGNGIGLSVAKKICELHEGKITIRPTQAQDSGITVEIILPY